MKKVPNILLFALFAFLASELLVVFQNQTIDQNESAKSLQNNFISLDEALKERIDLLSGNDSLLKNGLFSDPEYVSGLQSLFDTKGIVIFIYQEDSLVFWSSNNVPLKLERAPLDAKGVIILQNGWYFYRNHQYNDVDIIGLVRIYSLFKYQNKFLVNDFNPSLESYGNLFFVSDRGDQIGYKVLDSEGDFAFSLISRRESGFVKSQPFFHLLGLLLAIYSLFSVAIYAFKLGLRKMREGSLTKGLALFVTIIFGLRIFVFITGLPSAVMGTSLFTPEFYASSWFLPSLGDLLINVLAFGFFGFLLYTGKPVFFRMNLNRLASLSFTICSLAIIYLLCFQSLLIINGLVLNSQLSLGVGFIFDFNLYNFFGFFIIAVLFFSVFFYSQFILTSIWVTVNNNSKDFWYAVGLFFVVAFAILLLQGDKDYTAWMFFLAIVAVFLVGKLQVFSKNSFGLVFLAFFLFSILSTVALLRANYQKSLEQRKTLALSLSSDQDHLAEFLFLEMEGSLFDDHQLKNLVINNPKDEELVFRYLQHHYFYDFWDKYEIQVTITRPSQTWRFFASDVEVPIHEYFQDIIDRFGSPTISPNLVFLDNSYYPGRKSYISVIPVESSLLDGSGENYLVYLEFNTKFGVRETGLPELLVDDKADVYRGFEELSYAKYIDGRLVHKIGNFVYSFDLSVYGDFSDQFVFFDLDGYEHLVYQKNEGFHLLVSSPKNAFIENIAPFSPMFILMFLISLFLSREKLSEWLQITFKRRVQIYMVVLVAFSVVSIGIVSSFFLVKIYEQKNRDTIYEKSQSVLYEMQTIFGNESPLSEGYDYLVYEELLRLNRVFFTDINIFSPAGILVATSRPRVFEDGLIEKVMNPEAFSYLQSQQKGQFVHNERIGSLEFVSSYLPLHNYLGELIAYINLPYFAKQSQLRNEISLFVLAFVNIITILLMLALIAAILAAGYVTAPLQIIKDNISRIQLGKTNQKLQWKRRDEIGQLVEEYNRMIDEIERSAELLAKSERESAWREMAKQVAHEIKNPLTPMRLSIQHLEKSYRDNLPDWEERLGRFSKTMIDQIDNLSIIASEFSDFAKMPSGKKANLDLKKFIPEIIELFNNSERVDIRLDFLAPKQTLMVYADKSQLTRVFNNLVNNAIQAYPKEVKAFVVIRVETENGFVRCSVTDHGSGIPDEFKENIFRPNFTTKTSGMGLGLSMVKSIIENHGGKVSFDSKFGEFTIFSFTLPLM
jgi:signal transduction histidine kinase